MDDPFGDRFDCVFSPDRTRVAAWTIAARDVTPDEESVLYEIAVSEVRSGAPIAHVTRRWRRDLHTRTESGSPLAGVMFGTTGTLLILHYADGSREGVPLSAPATTPCADELVEEVSEFTHLLEAEPCSICGGAGWSTEVCASCARYCERLLVSGGVVPKTKR